MPFIVFEHGEEAIAARVPRCPIAFADPRGGDIFLRRFPDIDSVGTIVIRVGCPSQFAPIPRPDGMRFYCIGGFADIQETAAAGIIKVGEVNVAVFAACRDKGDSPPVRLPRGGMIGGGIIG